MGRALDFIEDVYRALENKNVGAIESDIDRYAATCRQPTPNHSFEAQSEQLDRIAASLGVETKELAQAAVADLLNADADDFQGAAWRILNKNRELYQRLSK